MQVQTIFIGVVGVNISMKSIDRERRITLTRAAYRKVLKTCSETEKDDNVFLGPRTSVREEDSISLGITDITHYKKPCVLILQDSSIDVLISDFRVLCIPARTIAVAMSMPSNPCHLVLVGKVTHNCFQLGQNTERVALIIQLKTADETNTLMTTIGDPSQHPSGKFRIPANNMQLPNVVKKELEAKLKGSGGLKSPVKCNQAPALPASKPSIPVKSNAVRTLPSPTSKQVPNSSIQPKLEVVSPPPTIVTFTEPMAFPPPGSFSPSSKETFSFSLERTTIKNLVKYFDSENYLIMDNDIPKTEKARKRLPPFQNNVSNTTRAEALLFKPPSGNTILTELVEEENHYINELQELQRALAGPGLSSEVSVVLGKLYEFHKLTFQPMLQKAATCTPKEVAGVFVKNRDNFTLYTELLLSRSRCLKSAKMESFSDRLLGPLNQLQKYKMCLTSLQKKEPDEGILQEAQDVIHSTVLGANHQLLLDSIEGFPFTPDQCGKLIHKGVLKVKGSKNLSRSKDYLTILTETQLIFAEKSLQRNQFSGNIRTDNLHYEARDSITFSIKGIMHADGNKMNTYFLTPANSEATDGWVISIRKVLDKYN